MDENEARSFIYVIKENKDFFEHWEKELKILLTKDKDYHAFCFSITFFNFWCKTPIHFNNSSHTSKKLLFVKAAKAFITINYPNRGITVDAKDTNGFLFHREDFTSERHRDIRLEFLLWVHGIIS